MRMLIKNAVLNGKTSDILIKNGKIEKIGKISGDGFDAGGLEIMPGLVDIHAHGFMGADTMDGDLKTISHALADCGTTTWYPTTMTESDERIMCACNADTNTGGANILGFHMEGPYISKKYKGAQNEKYIKLPSLEHFKKFKNIKLVTIAPELDAAMEFIKNCGCVVCLGHSNASYNDGVTATRSGAKCLTHTFNAMPPFHHREPSLIGAAITEDMYVQVITDGLHLHRAAVLALYRIFGADRMIIISDSMRASHLCDGEYEFGGQQITVKNGIAKTKDGTIAGSTSSLMDCVKTAVKMGIPKNDAMKMATETPSALMSINKGKITVGYDADILLCDSNLNVKKVMINGEFFR
mgnify:FL=1